MLLDEYVWYAQIIVVAFFALTFAVYTVAVFITVYKSFKEPQYNRIEKGIDDFLLSVLSKILLPLLSLMIAMWIVLGVARFLKPLF